MGEAEKYHQIIELYNNLVNNLFNMDAAARSKCCYEIYELMKDLPQPEDDEQRRKKADFETFFNTIARLFLWESKKDDDVFAAGYVELVIKVSQMMQNIVQESLKATKKTIDLWVRLEDLARVALSQIEEKWELEREIEQWKGAVMRLKDQNAYLKKLIIEDE